MTTETEGIAQSKTDLTLPAAVESIVQRFDVGVIREVVYRRRHYTVFYGQHRDYRLHRTCSAKKMAGHRLRGIDRDVLCMFAEQRDDCLRLGNIP